MSKTRKAAVSVYILVILYFTLFTRNGDTSTLALQPFWEYSNGMWRDIFLNIALFIPLGFLLGNRKGILFGIGLSVLIEIIQSVFR